MPDLRPIGDWHARSETHRRPTCLIRYQHASSETNMSHRRPIGDQHAWLETNRRPTCLMRHFCRRWGMLVSDEACRSPMRHVGLQWGISVSGGMLVSDMACPSLMGHVDLRGVTDQASRSPMGFRWVSDRSPIIIIFSGTHLCIPRDCIL